MEGCANALEILVPEHRALRIAGGSPTSGAVGGVCDSRVLRAPEPDGHAARGQARKKKKRECERVGSRQLVGQARGGVSAALGSRRTSERISQRIVAD